ncbi:MAG: zinc ribbon domain-containing protein [bacterium]|nr:zinc ribbon domain-containing protein [bacterium]
MHTIKGVKIPIQSSNELDTLLRSYRKGKNLFVEKLLISKKTSLSGVNSFRQEVRKQTGLSGGNSVLCSRDALGIYRSYRKKKKNTSAPDVKQLSMSVSLGYNGKLEKNRLRITVSPRKYVYVSLEMSEYHQQFLSLVNQGLLCLGEILVTPTHCIFTIKKEYTPYTPKGILTLDINEQSIVGLALLEDRVEIMAWSLERVYDLNCKYFEMARNLQRRYPSDTGLHKRVLSHWYKNRKHRVEATLHESLNAIISYAKEKELIIVHEELKNIKESINKRVIKKNIYNGQMLPHRKLPRKILGRLNRAVFRKVQWMLDYKAEWENIPYTYVSAWNNSQMCPICGGKNKSAEWHTFQCSCGSTANRHLNACLNIAKKYENERLRLSLDRSAMNYIMEVSTSVPKPH